MYIRIYKEKKAATQSLVRSNKWILEVVPSFDNTFHEDILGWNGTTDTQKQIILKFQDKESAIKYANTHGMTLIHDYQKDNNLKQKRKNYLQNFQL